VDAGMSDASSDAGTPDDGATTDAGGDGGAASAPEDGGCGCEAAGRATPRSSVIVLALILGAASRRRRGARSPR
jgi:MYXO-CTERM domain-containing protein